MTLGNEWLEQLYFAFLFNVKEEKPLCKKRLLNFYLADYVISISCSGTLFLEEKYLLRTYESIGLRVYRNTSERVSGRVRNNSLEYATRV